MSLEIDRAEARTTRSVYLIALNGTRTKEPVGLFNATSSTASDFVWLGNDTIGYRNSSSFWSSSVKHENIAKGNDIQPEHMFDFPAGVSASGIQYNVESGILAFNAQVWADGDLSTAEVQNRMYAERGTTGVVFDELFIR